MRPPIPLTDRRFIYTPSHATDLHKTFERIRREQREQREQKRPDVIPIKRKGG